MPSLSLEVRPDEEEFVLWCLVNRKVSRASLEAQDEIFVEYTFSGGIVLEASPLCALGRHC